MSEFLAIDFETANNRRDSACAIGLVRVSDGRIVAESHHLIRPPTPEFRFTHIHGITWTAVADKPDFFEVWDSIGTLFEGVDFISAHNARFDKGVLEACCDRFGLGPPRTPYLCTVELARRLWNLRPTKLPDVCRFLGIPLDHHRADSDSRACAEIVLAAEADSWRYAGQS
ncbi:MAG: exonuclease [Alphaproteobacteria bacterium]|nr:MAG: exonuclease [Alphaproteobacteria bacterium]